MQIFEVTRIINSFFEQHMKQKCRILSLLPEDGKWKAVCEIADPHYTTGRELGDIAEAYEAQIDENLNITGFTLKATKRRAALDDE